MMPGMASELVTAQAIADLYAVAPETVATWAREGKIPTATTTPGGHRRYRIADVLAAFPVAAPTTDVDAERAS